MPIIVASVERGGVDLLGTSLGWPVGTSRPAGRWSAHRQRCRPPRRRYPFWGNRRPEPLDADGADVSGPVGLGRGRQGAGRPAVGPGGFEAEAKRCDGCRARAHEGARRRGDGLHRVRDIRLRAPGPPWPIARHHASRVRQERRHEARLRQGWPSPTTPALASGGAALALLGLLSLEAPLGALAALSRRTRLPAALLTARASALVGPRLLGRAAVLGVGPARRFVLLIRRALLRGIMTHEPVQQRRGTSR